MITKIFQIVFCSLFLISCSQEKVIIKEYSKDDIKLEWYYTEYLYQRSNDYIEITCPLINTVRSKTIFNFPEGWIENVDIKDEKIHISHTITSDIITKVVVKDSICDYSVILNELNLKFK
jgi:hypothetical protein